MNRKRIVIVVSVVVVLVCLVTGGFILTTKKGNKETTNTTTAKQVSIEAGNLAYTVKQEIKQQPITKETPKVNKEFQVNDIKESGDKLAVTVNADIENADQAYQMAVLLENSIKTSNKDKVEKDGIKKIEIVLKGSSKSWMYDNNASIKEIEIKK